MRTSIAGFAAMMLFLPGLASAAPAKVGYVNVPYLIDNAPQAKSASNELKEEFQPRQEKIQAEQQKYRQLQKKLQKDDLVMSDEEKAETKSELEELERKIKRMKKALQEDVNIKKNDAFKGVRKAVQKVVQEFADDNNYDVIVGRGALYASDSVNVTEDVLQELKEDYNEGGGE